MPRRFAAYLIAAVIAGSAQVAGVQAHAQSQVTLSPTQDEPYDITVIRQGHVIWADETELPLLAVDSRRKTMLFSDTGDEELIVRQFHGTTKVIPLAYAALDFCGADGVVLVTESGPNPAADDWWDATKSRGWLAERPIQAIRQRNGRILWTSDPTVVGLPLWTNGDVFVSAWVDTSPRMAARFREKHVPLPVWLEERDLSTRRLLWRKRIPGCRTNWPLRQ
jgi:hypothetical protein